MRKLREMLNEMLRRSSAPTRPAASTFGGEANRQAARQTRDRDFDRAIAIDKGRTKRSMGG